MNEEDDIIGGSGLEEENEGGDSSFVPSFNASSFESSLFLDRSFLEEDPIQVEEDDGESKEDVVNSSFLNESFIMDVDMLETMKTFIFELTKFIVNTVATQWIDCDTNAILPNSIFKVLEDIKTSSSSRGEEKKFPNIDFFLLNPSISASKRIFDMFKGRPGIFSEILGASMY